MPQPLAARLAERLGSRTTIAAGQFLMVVGLLTLCLTAVGMPAWLVAVPLIPVGLGGPLAMAPATALLLDSVPGEQTGTASGVLNTCRQLGGALAVAVFGALIAQHATFLHGVRLSLLIAALLLDATAASSLLLRPTPRQRPQHITAELAGSAMPGVDVRPESVRHCHIAAPA